MEEQSVTPDNILQIRAYNYYSLASFVLLYYEYFLTFNGEVKFFWKRKPNLVTVLFFVNRYLSLVVNVPVVVHNLGNLAEKNCDKLHTFNQICIVVVQVLVGSISAIRTYAIYGRRRDIQRFLACSIICGIGGSIWSLIGKSTVSITIPSTFGCHSTLTEKEGTRLAVVWMMLFSYDAIIFALTILKALRIYEMGSSRLYRVLVRDGSVYFLIMAMANLSNILTFLLAPPFLKGVSTAFSNVISSTLTSRLLLNIQNPKSFESTMASEILTTSANIGPFVTNIVDDRPNTLMDEWNIDEADLSQPPTWHSTSWEAREGTTSDRDIELSTIR